MTAIISTGFFRSGTTFLFAAMRCSDQVRCYYEPLHPDIVNLATANIDHSKELRHSIASPWHEYLDAETNRVVQGFHNNKTDFIEGINPIIKGNTFAHNYMQPSREVLGYIRSLHGISADRNCSSFLGFNRLNMTAHLYKAYLPGSLLVYCDRSPASIALSVMSLVGKDKMTSIFNPNPEQDWGISEAYKLCILDYDRTLLKLSPSFYAKVHFLVKLSYNICAPHAEIILNPEMSLSEYLDHLCLLFAKIDIDFAPARNYVEQNYRQAKHLQVHRSLLSDDDNYLISSLPSNSSL